MQSYKIKNTELNLNPVFSIYTKYFIVPKVNLNPSAGVYGVEIPSGTWHSIIALEPGTVIFEIKSGPYKPLPPEDIAPWAPAPSDLEGAAVFMKRMLEV